VAEGCDYRSLLHHPEAARDSLPGRIESIGAEAHQLAAQGCQGADPDQPVTTKLRPRLSTASPAWPTCCAHPASGIRIRVHLYAYPTA